ncbi:MAG: NtrC family signal transduction histidine kinase [Ignavibacteria bacterium]|nr:NtrC family signal transduction histidine kinase [Ignavibacteria bacterium]
MTIKPNIKTILFGTLIIATLIFIFVIIEYLESRGELLSLLKKQAGNLTESLSLSFENTITSNIEAENLLTDKLNSVAFLVAQYQSRNKNIEPELKELVREFQVDGINIVNSKGVILFSTIWEEPHGRLDDELLTQLKPIFDGDYQWLNMGLLPVKPDERQKYIFARIGKDKNTIVIIFIDADKILHYRKKFGIGAQIRQIADNDDIEYLLLQDKDGIVSASKGIDDISSIESDTFVRDAFQSGRISTRLIDYKDKKIFEIAKTLILPDNSILLLRLALSTENIRAIQQRSMRRVIIIGIGIFILFSILYAYIIIRKGYSRLKVEHRKIVNLADLVLDNMADAVIAVNGEKIILYFNNSASRITGLEPLEVIGKSYQNVFSGYKQILSVLTGEGPVVNQELEIINSKNEKITLEISISNILNGNLEPELSIIIFKDLTEKKRLRTQLERNEKLSAMGELAAGVAHEIRNPLNSINIIAQRIQREFQPKEKKDDFEKFMQTIRSEIVRVNNIVKQFLEFSKPQKLLISKENVIGIIEECQAVFESEAKLNNILIINDFPGIPLLSLDKGKMKQVFINLYKNSIDSIGSNGSVNSALQIRNNSVEIKIADTGKGIPDELISKVFNLYFTTKPHGTGLGLSIVHQIISEHNGSISLTSQENIGTEVIINLPVE